MNPITIAVRGYAVPLKDRDGADTEKPKVGKRKGLRKPSHETLIFDCETTTDHTQNLRFGTYQCRKKGILVEQGIFYEPDNPKLLSLKDIAVIRDYASKRGLDCLTRDEFIQKIFYRYAYAYGAAVVGFNLPFDISRLAIRYGTAHARDMRGGFSFKLSNTPHHPNVVIKHLNSKTSFTRFAASGQWDSRSERKKGIKKQHRRGYFQDVKTLAAALLGGRGHSLKALADTLQTEHRKLEADGHDLPITSRYLDYAMSIPLGVRGGRDRPTALPIEPRGLIRRGLSMSFGFPQHSPPLLAQRVINCPLEVKKDPLSSVNAPFADRGHHDHPAPNPGSTCPLRMVSATVGR